MQKRCTKYNIWSNTGLHPWNTAFTSLSQWFLFVFQELNLIMFSDNMNLFHEHKNMTRPCHSKRRIKKNINDSFISNKFCLHVWETKHLSFRKASRVVALQLNILYKKVSYTKNIYNMLKIKNVGLTYQAKSFLGKDPLFVMLQ